MSATLSTRADAGQAPGDKLVELVDRFFFVLADGRAAEVAADGIGPAYIGAAALVHHVTGLDADDALVLLTRASFVLAIACGSLLVRALVHRSLGPPVLVSLGAQIVFVAGVFAAGTWHWSDVPWSHFFAAFAAIGLYAARYVPTRITLLTAGLIGGALALLWLTRTFELLTVVIAWALTAALFALLRLRDSRALRLQHVVAGATTFLVTTAAVYLLTGKRDLFFLYEGRLDAQSGSVEAGEVAATPTLSLTLLPTKLVQLFVEPCYRSLCSVSDYSGRASSSPLLTQEAGNLRLWSLPLGIQLPSLLLIPVSLVVLGVLVVLAARHRERFAARLSGLRLMVEMSVAAAGIILGYSASTLTGSPHLRYGFARDFLLPAFLGGVVGVTLLSAGIWLLLSRRRRRARVSPEFVFVLLAFATSAALVAGLAYARADGIPRIESRQLAEITYTARCGQSCRVAVDARTPSGAALSIPDASVLTFACGSGSSRFSTYRAHLSEVVNPGSSCANPRLVAAWPTVMGLPPGSFELAAVDVRNG